MPTPDILGLDFGGVIVSTKNDATENSMLGDGFLNAPANKGAVEGIKLLADSHFSDRIHIVSRCGPAMQDKIQKWLDTNRFFKQTGLFRSNVHFCLKDEEKAIFAEILGLTHFVDNKLDVLDVMPAIRNRFLFQPTLLEYQRYARYRDDIATVQSWPELTSLILSGRNN